MSASQKPASRGGKSIGIVLLLLVAVAGVALWVMQETLDKGAPSLPGFSSNSTSSSSQSAPAGGDAASPPRGTPLAPGLQAGERPLVEAPPSALAVPSLLPGGEASQAGRDGTQPGAAGQPENTPFIAGGGDVVLPLSPTTMPHVKEDGVVRLAFVDDLAAFLVENYWPKGAHPSARQGGISTVSINWANLRYGGELQGMRRGDDLAQARAAVLRYVLNPSMLEGLYKLYIDRFLAVLEAAADARRVGPAGKERPLTSAEKKEMLNLYAAQARGLGAALTAYSSGGGMRERVEKLQTAVKAVEDANRVYMESVGAYEELQAGNKRVGLDAARARMDRDAAAYQRVIQAREQTREDLVRAMQQGGATRGVGDDTLVYVASWAYRRGTTNPEALRTAAQVLQSAGSRLAAAAKAEW